MKRSHGRTVKSMWAVADGFPATSHARASMRFRPTTVSRAPRYHSTCWLPGVTPNASSQAPPFSRNSTKPDRGLQRGELRLNGGAWLEAFGVTPGSQHVEWYRGALDTVVGLNRIEARAWDVAGNPSATAHIDFTVRPWDLFIHVQPASRFFVPGEAVNYSVDMTNVGNETTALYWSSFCQAYITVEDQTGKEWLNQSRGQTCAPAFSNITLAPGERYTTNGSWDQRDNGRNPVPTPDCYVLRQDRKSTRLNSSHVSLSRMPS